MLFQMRQMNLYLHSHPDILSKKFVLFTHNDENEHWWGWIAINPWVQIAKVLDDCCNANGPDEDSDNTIYSQYGSGLLACDGLNSEKTFRSSLCFI